MQVWEQYERYLFYEEPVRPVRVKDVTLSGVTSDVRKLLVCMLVHPISFNSSICSVYTGLVLSTTPREHLHLVI